MNKRTYLDTESQADALIESCKAEYLRQAKERAATSHVEK